MKKNEEIISAIKNNISIAATLRELGLKPKGENYKTIHKKVKEFNIDTSHWLGKRHAKSKKRTNVKSIPLELVLVENCEYSRKQLKLRLEKENILKKECYICGQTPEWNGKKLILILDHINGIYNDNRIDNLRMICPNCNSQLDTFCGRKNKGKIKKKENFCINCGTNITRKAKRCISCSYLNLNKYKK